MFSVIIQNQKTIDSFNKFRPLFQEALDKNQIAVCRWIESGTSIDTTVPDLAAKINDKEAWRAIILRVYDEYAMTSHQTDIRNPFDFISTDYGDASMRYTESNVPIVRLTQLLGGFPTPIPEFVPKKVEEEGKAPRVVFEAVENPEDVQTHKALSEKFHLNAKHPSEIILVSIRKKEYKHKDEVVGAWQSNNETMSSEFWKRNQYPSVCRFMVYEMDRQGPVIEAADFFKFWSSIMLLSVNQVEASTLQAYRLYRFDLLIKHSEMEAGLAGQYAKLLGAQSYIKESMKKDDAATTDVSKILPKYDVEVPVPLVDMKKFTKISNSHGSFGMISKGPVIETNKWNAMKRDIDEKTKRELDIAEQSLDRTADKVRDFLDFEERGPVEIDKFQLRDITGDLNNICKNIIETQYDLPKETISHDAELKKIDKNVRQKIHERMTFSKAWLGYGIVSVVFLLLVIPSYIFFSQHAMGSALGIIILAIAAVSVPAIIELLVLLWQRHIMRRAALAYKKKHNELVRMLHNNVDRYSEYMSDIATHARGSSFLRIVKKQKLFKEYSFAAKQRHLRDVNLFLASIYEWQTAFYCERQNNADDVAKSFIFDIEVPSHKNRLYTFDYDEQYTLDLNNSGTMLKSPVNFYENLSIEREELYDDYRLVN